MSTSAEAPASLRPETSPILIVGAGPTGLTAALELTRLGVPVRLVDKRSAPATTSRALAIQARTLELLHQRGLAAELLRLGNAAHATALYSSAKLLGKVDLTLIRSPYNFILLLAQSETERVLREQVARQGVDVAWGTELIALAQDEAASGAAGRGGVRAVLRRPDGALEELSAAYLIGAEGAHSLVRHTLNLPFPGKALAQHYALADLHLDGDLPDDELSIFLGDNGFLAVFPMKNRRFRFISTTPDPQVPDAGDPTLADLQRLYDASACIPARLRDLSWSSRFHINSRLVDHLQAGRIFLGGDAAHVHSPAGGQGMNTGIQDMIDLGWKLALVWHGHASPALLATYDQDRLPLLRGLVATTERATDLLNSTNPLVHQLLTHGLPLVLGQQFVQHTGAGLLSQVAAHYRASGLSHTQHASGALHGGDRVPDMAVRAGALATTDQRLYDLLDPSRFTLLVTGPDLHTALPADWARQLQPWQALVQVQHLVPAPGAAGAAFAEAFGAAPSLLLVRPDAYVGLVAAPAGWAALLSWLHRWLPGPAARP